MKKILLFSVFAILFSNLADAQSWQWGKRGGSADNMTGYGPIESVVDMAIDPNGNVYVLSSVGKTALNVNGHSKTASSRYGDIMISSFSCDGSYRWSKVIGGPVGDKGNAIKTDALGGVYVLGSIISISSYGHCLVDADTTLAYTNQNILLVKYDTAGNYKWLRMPEPDTVSIALRSPAYDLAVDPDGTCHIYGWLKPGGFCNGGFVNTDTSACILKYNAQGIFLGGVKLPITGGDVTSYMNLKFIHSPKSGKYYFNGTSDNIIAPQLTINGTTYSKSFISAFDAGGNFIWGRQTTGYWNIHGRPALDANGRIFISSAARPGFSFNGFTGTTTNLGTGGPVVNAMDTNGTSLWNTSAITNSSAGGQAIAANGMEVAIAGDYTGTVHWTGAKDSLNLPANYLGNVLFARFNAATGAYIKQDSLYSPSGYIERATAITTDKNRNYYIGGYFETQINVAKDTLISNGGETDFFVAKYGLPCGCTSAPTSNFSFGYTGKAVQFTYNGSTAQADSVVWTFGDGQKQTVKSGFTAPITHTYNTSGTYNACATIYAYCGTATTCKNVTVTGSGAVGALSALGNIKVYPNPTNQYLTIEGAEGASAMLVNSIGQRAMQFSIGADKQQIDIGTLPAGMYILQLTDVKGNRGAMSILKQ